MSVPGPSEIDAALDLAERMRRPVEWRRDFVRHHGGRCHYCNRPGESVEVGPDARAWHVDHKHPLARGGKDDDTNLVLACKRCNVTKGTRLYEEFREYARLNFWVPDAWPLSSFDLSKLEQLTGRFREEARSRTANPAPLLADGDRVVRDNGDGDLEELFRIATSRSSSYPYIARDACQFMAEVVAALPHLIAEVRLHRSEESS